MANTALQTLHPSARLNALGITLPDASHPIATYRRYRRVGNLIYLSGQGSMLSDGSGVFGKVGRDVSLENGIRAARITALNLMSQAQLICDGDIDRVHQWVSMTGYVNAASDFCQHPKILDGATTLLERIFGEDGLAARTAIGVSSLPMNITVEIQASFEICP